MSKKTKKILLILIIIIIILISTSLFGKYWLGCNYQNNLSNFQINKADNWYLPSNIQPSLNSGIYADKNDKFSVQAENVELIWKDISPSEGVFNWGKLKTALEEAKKRDRGIWLRIYMSDAIYAPDWFKQKYPDIKLVEYGSYPDNIYHGSKGQFYPLWQPEFELEVRNMILSLSKQNIISDPNFMFMYAPFAWRWNEWVMKFPERLEADGYNPDKFLVWFKQHLEIYTKNFQGYEQKLMYTGTANMDFVDDNLNWIKVINDTKNGRNKLTDMAVNLGMSVRLGDLEFFNNYSSTPSWGSPSKEINNYNYQIPDESNSLVSNPKRLIGTENEAFGDENMFKCTVNHYYDRLVTLKSLQLGANWLNIQQFNYDNNPEIINYARKVMGKRGKDSVDAWVLLREWKDLSTIKVQNVGKDNLPFNAEVPFRNFEKQLIQREISPDGLTKSVLPIDSSSGLDFLFYNGSSFEARSTDFAKGSNYIYFKADPSFVDTEKKYKVSITYLDEGSSNWSVQYFNLNKQESSSNLVQNMNTGKWKRVLIDLPNISYNQQYSNNMDFRIYNGGKTDAIFSLVRIIKE